ncbi:hypothetical protein BT96DRAFT_675606 [Gymnopus androsaceus JB14]|uniref:Uncharacterized protein n=1 Tax=Gymnopus androsaceus JB14 TaxID=1447944 RepID=A0A6A4HRA3_9AGAR|nr:hypothetical protein BT96DRAFT_675606 [Gymnopus androsaceus JB14]
MSTVWFMVDDTDPRIDYSGSWYFNTTVADALGRNDYDLLSVTGPAFNSTVHTTTGNASLAFRFNGSSNIGVYGTLDGINEGGFPVPHISCVVDPGGKGFSSSESKKFHLQVVHHLMCSTTSTLAMLVVYHSESMCCKSPSQIPSILYGHSTILHTRVWKILH